MKSSIGCFLSSAGIFSVSFSDKGNVGACFGFRVLFFFSTLISVWTGDDTFCSEVFSSSSYTKSPSFKMLLLLLVYLILVLGLCFKILEKIIQLVLKICKSKFFKITLSFLPFVFRSLLFLFVWLPFRAPPYPILASVPKH